MKTCQHIMFLFLNMIFCTASWSEPARFIEVLESAASPADLQTDNVETWKKLSFLCEYGLKPSLNPRCYDLAKFESEKWQESLSGRFPSWWEGRCAEYIHRMSWKDLMKLAWKQLPASCQEAWRSRREELLYRFSQDDLEFLWRHRRQ